MLFLNPAVLFGLLAASIPVLIHMLNLRKLKRIDFSTIVFLKELQKNKIRKIKLKQWLLLALRVLVILFLVMAFARPTVKGIAIGGTSSAAKTTAVFVLDDTFSMSVVDAGGSYLNQAKSEIHEILKQLQDGDDVALVLVSGDEGNEIRTTGNIAALEKKVSAVKISGASGVLNDAVIKAAKILDRSKNFNREIYILSDFQAGRISGGGQQTDLGQVLNDRVRIYTVDYSGGEIFNLGIDNFKTDNQIFEKDKPVNFSVTITNYSDRRVNNAVVSLYLNGVRSSQQSLTLNPGASGELKMQAVPKSTGYFEATAAIEDDDILRDNRRYLNFFIPDQIPVIFFSDNPGDSRYVKLALTAGEEKSLVKIIPKDIAQLSSVDLSRFSVVFIVGAGSSTGTERLKSYLNSGGGLFLMPGEQTTADDFNKFLRGLNLPVVTGAYGKLNSQGNPVTFDKTEFAHPVFSDIFTRGTRPEIESPDIYHFLRISTEGKGTNIISLMDGSSFLGEYKSGTGKILLMNTAPLLSWSDFPLKGIFVPLINKSVFYLASRERQNSEYLAGERVLINPAGRASTKLKIVRPDREEDYINLQKELVNNYIRYNNTAIAGNYKVYSNGAIVDEISVNSDPRESVPKYAGNSGFGDYLKQVNFRGNLIRLEKGSNPAEIIKRSRFGSELWKYFILVALILALVEMTVARNAKKELVNVGNNRRL